MRTQKDKFEGQCRVLSDQLELYQNSNDELAVKKNHEGELMSKEITSLTMKEKDARSQLMVLESEVGDVRDQLRSLTNELDTRTQENDHLISLLEDQESKMTLYE